jgi:hypothetical protein
MDRREEISGGFIITRGDGSELLELAEEVLILSLPKDP